MRDRRWAVFLGVSLLLSPVAASSQQPARPSAPARPVDPVAAEHWQKRVDAVAALHRARGISDEAGVQCCSILQIPAAAFNPTSSGVTYQHDGNGYIHALTLSFADWEFWAPVNLPSGTEVVYLDLYYYDNATGEVLCGQLWRHHGGTPGEPTPGENVIVSACSPGGVGGYGVAESLPTSYTINNDAEFETGGGQYFVQVGMPSNIPDLAFKGVDIWYLQQVSPAPGTASFNDVPTSDPAFQFIEALKASGITAGCGGGNYCPDAPLTRRQMAVFLAKALGLYWPY